MMLPGQEPASTGARRERVLYRQSGGELYDDWEHRTVCLGELSQEVRAGHLFRAYDQATGSDCTYEVLGAVITRAMTAPAAALAAGLSGTGPQTVTGLSPAP
ncbi:polyhydroxyalkanoate synthesis regulator DNA-binding domain-containing protein [Streptomyces enissocaesilis]|uniref:PHA accumulation regulator DNA-binding N-terminal domain-containing protein n=1 Tax=Streptomyces enissocaesilis TaxID=332589 RepID=A0ABN3X675_9ACTN